MVSASNSGPISGVGNVGIRRAEIKQGEDTVLVLGSLHALIIHVFMRANRNIYTLLIRAVNIVITRPCRPVMECGSSSCKACWTEKLSVT